MNCGDNRELTSRVEITGMLQKKGILKANISAPWFKEDVRDALSYKWFSSDEKEGCYEQVIGAYQDMLPLAASSVGKYYKCQAAVIGLNEDVLQTMEGDAVGPIMDINENPNTYWLAKGKYGISHHFLAEFINRVATDPSEKWQTNETWNDVINSFDVEYYVRQVVKSGAGFVILTLGQNSGYLLSPNATYDRIAGVKPGERASTRDLPVEIADALALHGIKLILYLPANPPSKAHKTEGDFGINNAFDYPVEIAPSQETQAKWQAVIKEWSDRYKDKLAGWWFDGMWFQEAYNDLTKKYNWFSLVNAAKSGNPTRIVAFNSGIGSNILVNSPFEDYTAGETNEIGPLPAGSQWADEANCVQWFNWTFLGKYVTDLAGWGNNGLNWETNELIRWVKAATDRKGVIALDINVNRFGRMNQLQFGQLMELKKFIKIN